MNMYRGGVRHSKGTNVLVTCSGVGRAFPFPLGGTGPPWLFRAWGLVGGPSPLYNYHGHARQGEATTESWDKSCENIRGHIGSRTNILCMLAERGAMVSLEEFNSLAQAVQAQAETIRVLRQHLDEAAMKVNEASRKEGHRAGTSQGER